MCNTLYAGFCRADITPTVPVGLRGYGNDNRRLHERVRDPIFVTCIALRQAEETALLFTLDSCVCMPELLEDAVFEATGIPKDKHFYGATHCHNGPNYSDYVQGSQEAKAILLKQAAFAAKAAIADLSPATLSHNAAKIEKMNFVRHYTLNTGEIADTGLSNYPKDAFVGYPVEADKTMAVVKFSREGKKDILLVNWGAHPDHSGMLDPEKPREENFKSISADFPGALRNKLMADTGAEVAYFTGASGNTTPFTRIIAHRTGLNMTQYGEKLAEHALQILADAKPVSEPAMASRQETIVVEIDHTLDHMVDKAEEVYALFQQTDLATSRPLANSYGMQSAYEARAIMNRAAMEQTLDMRAGVLRIGDLCFINHTYEMFSDIGSYLRENAPFANTFIIAGNNSYVCSRYAYDFGAYEAVTGWYKKGTAEKLAEHYVDMLKEIQ